MTSKKIGITGATGVLGKILIKKLDYNGLEYSCFKGDISSINNVRNWINTNSFNKVIHLAAMVPITDVKNNPDRAYAVNVEGTKNLVNVLNESNKNPWLFYASTSHIYRSKNNPISEDDIKEPISEYGKTKYEAEKEIFNNYKNYCIGRIFSFYHDTQKKPFLYPSIKDRLEKEDLDYPFELYGADSVRDFLNAEDVVDIIMKLMQREIVGIYNIASGKGIQIKDFVQGLAKKRINIKKIGDSDYLVADISRLKKVLEQNEKEYFNN